MAISAFDKRMRFVAQACNENGNENVHRANDWYCALPRKEKKELNDVLLKRFATFLKALKSS